MDYMYERCDCDSCVFCNDKKVLNECWDDEITTKIVSFSPVLTKQKLSMNEIQIKEFANILFYESHMYSSVADNLINFSSAASLAEEQYFRGIAIGFEMAKKELEKYVCANLD